MEGDMSCHGNDPWIRLFEQQERGRTGTRNRYAGKCTVCGGPVPVGACFLFGRKNGAWDVQHASRATCESNLEMSEQWNTKEEK
jgi:hypothetical protein